MLWSVLCDINRSAREFSWVFQLLLLALYTWYGDRLDWWSKIEWFYFSVVFLVFLLWREKDWLINVTWFLTSFKISYSGDLFMFNIVLEFISIVAFLCNGFY